MFPSSIPRNRHAGNRHTIHRYRVKTLLISNDIRVLEELKTSTPLKQKLFSGMCDFAKERFSLNENAIFAGGRSGFSSNRPYPTNR